MAIGWNIADGKYRLVVAFVFGARRFIAFNINYLRPAESDEPIGLRDSLYSVPIA